MGHDKNTEKSSRPLCAQPNRIKKKKQTNQQQHKMCDKRPLRWNTDFVFLSSYIAFILSYENEWLETDVFIFVWHNMVLLPAIQAQPA